jgi:hypothetical protein
MYYLSDIERNCKIVRLRGTKFDPPFVSNMGVAESFGDWRLLSEIVNRLGPSAGLVVSGGRQ